METDPLCSGLRDVFQQLIINSEGEQQPFTLVKNPWPHHLITTNNLSAMYDSLCKQLARDNSQLGYALMSTLQQIYVCLSCGNRTSDEQTLPVFKLAHKSDHPLSQLTVRLKVIYLYDDDNYKRYELRLKPGEYTFIEIN